MTKEFNPHSPDCKLSRDYSICDSCRLVKTNSEFDERNAILDEVVAAINDAKSGRKATSELFRDSGMSKAIDVVENMR